MTDLKFLINGQDFSALVHKNGYRTYLDPVYSGEITTLDGVRRAALLRYRGRLHIILNDLDEGDSARLTTALMRDPVLVSYHSFQRNADVTEQMRLDPYAREMLMQDAGTRVLAEVTLKFEQN